MKGKEKRRTLSRVPMQPEAQVTKLLFITQTRINSLHKAIFIKNCHSKNTLSMSFPQINHKLAII